MTMEMNEALAREQIGESMEDTAKLVENKRLFAPVETINYDFPVLEVPMKAALDTRSNIEYLPTDMKAIVRLDTGKVISTVSNKYKLVPHAAVIDTMEEQLKKHHDYERKIYTTHDGARIYSEYKLKGYNADIGEGDPVSLNFIGRNSYDGSCAMSIILQGLRLACLNGLMGMGNLFYFSRRHTLNIKVGDDLSREINRAITVYNDSLIPFWKKLNEKELSRPHGIDIIKDTSEKKVLPAKFSEDVERKWETEASKTNAWFLYNCYTAVLTHQIKKVSYENYINISRKVGQYFKGRFFAN